MTEYYVCRACCNGLKSSMGCRVLVDLNEGHDKLVDCLVGKNTLPKAKWVRRPLKYAVNKITATNRQR